LHCAPSGLRILDFGQRNFDQRGACRHGVAHGTSDGLDAAGAVAFSVPRFVHFIEAMPGAETISNTGKTALSHGLVTTVHRAGPPDAGGLVAYRSAAQAGGKIVSAENAWKKFFLNLIFVRQVAAQHSSLAPQM